MSEQQEVGSVVDTLKRIDGKRIAYIPNPGNAGDSVIAAATYQMLDSLGIDYHVPEPHRFDAKGWTVIYGGGGNMIGPRTFSSRVIGRLAKSAERLIVLPHTVKNNEELLGSLGKNTTVFCRERYSYTYVTGLKPNCEVGIDDDMAFHLNLDVLDTRRLSSASRMLEYLRDKAFSHRAVPMWSNVVRATRVDSIFKKLRSQSRGNELNCFRRDGEMTDLSI